MILSRLEASQSAETGGAFKTLDNDAHANKYLLTPPALRNKVRTSAEDASEKTLNLFQGEPGSNRDAVFHKVRKRVTFSI